ncbi:vacuolar protein sorting-associated protein 27 [Mucor ambiguus]|uniref:Vacuolar protein sorting-associated protein 27 n=1 Tax=Mucor ambiguus TaxID=91626 RepID=A0A0C9MJN6_9FUNG|nr:vacuolar protein sorting-associated protein 27 [Mucor ambiguus]
MGSFWWGSNGLDELIEKATSELLPAGQVDLALHLEISDQIRSKKVNAKDAMRSLKQRLNHKNPNVVMSTLELVDTCVKNSGSTFVKEVATREFMEELTHIIKMATGSSHVKSKTLSLIQVWGIASKGNPALSYISDTYTLLRAEGYTFPHVTDKIDSTLFETAVAPEWTDSACCERCRTSFTLTNRKHHCRQCGATFCQQCSSKSMPLPHLGINDSVRVCDGCYIKVKLAKVADRDAVPHLLGTPASISSSLTPTYTPSIKNKAQTTTTATTASNTNNNNNSSAANDDQFEDDIKKAIELSLKESQQQQKLASFYSSEQKEEPAAANAKNKSAGEDEEEANLAAAIAASLQDMKLSAASTAKDDYPKYNSNDLSPIDMENIQLFSTLMQRVQSAANDVSGDTQINQLYTQIGTLQPKLVRTLNDTSRKHEMFVHLHTKLNQAVKAYDKLIEDRLASATQRTRTPSYPTYYNHAQTAAAATPQVQHQYLSTWQQPMNVYPHYSAQTPISLPLSQPAQPQPHSQTYPQPQPQPQPVSTLDNMRTHQAPPPLPPTSGQQQWYPSAERSPYEYQPQSTMTPVPVQTPVMQPTPYPVVSHGSSYTQPQPQQQQQQQKQVYHQQPVEEAPLIEL